MNSLIVAVVLIAFVNNSAECSPSQQRQPSHEEGRGDLEVSSSHHGWSALGYQGPLAVPEVRGDGTLADTPEVSAARAAHQAALQAAIATNPDNDDGHYDPHKYGDDLYGVVSHVDDLTNSIAHYNTLARGHHSTGSVSAHEQARAQAQASAQVEAELALWKANSAASAAATATGGHSYTAPAEQNKPYFGPLAMLQVLPSGYLADTQEVASAKQIHLSALAEAQTAEALWRAKHAQAQHRPWN